jgi:glycopeptide antibiotics resistance protein
MVLFISAYIGIFLLGFQQQNVIHGHYKLAAVTSFSIAVTQYLIINGVVAGDWTAVIQLGLGGSLGIMSSMYAHRRFVKRGDKPRSQNSHT